MAAPYRRGPLARRHEQGRAARQPPAAGSAAAGSAAAGTDGWTEGRLVVDGRDVFYRRGPTCEGVPLVHVHGFAISGSYLMPTARRLADHGTAVVPDLPGYGRSERSPRPLGIVGLARSLEGILDGLGLDQVVLVGNSMGCAVSLEVAHASPERVHRLVLVSPAGGLQNQPFRRALRQLARDVVREDPRMAGVAVPDYVGFGAVNAFRAFHELTLFPALERLVSVPVPTLAVLGDRDPLVPGPRRVREVQALSHDHIAVVLIQGAAHAINFSHPGQLANVIGAWLDDRDVVDDPTEPGTARTLTPRRPGGGPDGPDGPDGHPRRAA
ncbi:alpha/beta fold hydrolase [Cellulomonas sp. KH9]|uniref:alpha/beta fold hydrolase n=1 Tax=Cellulomonas sp. KH9 TaxID=1855324 RepID=UPI0008E72F7E|nr:alpha/beta fold hydrolase [Cellulomonas sp. KH9]SFJ98801.1 Pimeloyl-ACP methyl ester carboxylesterase [Cellulomonas sp. KH9]